MDVVTLALAKKYTREQIMALSGGFNFLGKKPTAADLPASGNSSGDTWYIVATQQFCTWIPSEWVINLGASDTMAFIGTITGDNASKSFTITHNLNSKDVVVQLYDTATNEQIFTDVKRDTVNTVVIDFAENVPTGTEYKVVISA